MSGPLTGSALARALRDPLAWAIAALLLLTLGMPSLKPLFAAAFPALARPMYEQDSFAALLLDHVRIVALSSGFAVVGGIGAGVLVTRASGKKFRPLVDSLIAIGQTVPPVAVLAIAVPLLGFGAMPAVIALTLYGLLPIVRGTIAGIEAVPQDARDAADGLGMHAGQRFWFVEMPLALPALLAGVRASVVIGIGTAAIASTAGASTLGLPIIVGLTGFNTAYVIQGAVLVALLAIVTDMAFDRLDRSLGRWREPNAPQSARKIAAPATPSAGVAIRN